MPKKKTKKIGFSRHNFNVTCLGLLMRIDVYVAAIEFYDLGNILIVNFPLFNLNIIQTKIEPWNNG